VVIDPASVRPTRDNVLLRLVPYKHEFLEVRGIALNKGEVVAIGPGRRIRKLVRYRRGEGFLSGDLLLPDGDERVDKNGAPLIRPMRVKVGEWVEFSNYKHMIEFEYSGEQYVLLPEQSIYGKDLTQSQSQAILAQRTAGYSRDGSFLARGTG
jgi:co-chaperonin GroES (HSP10)